jgi:hypothetical protein
MATKTPVTDITSPITVPPVTTTVIGPCIEEVIPASVATIAP